MKRNEWKYVIIGGGSGWSRGPRDYTNNRRDAGKIARAMRDGYGDMLDWIVVYRRVEFEADTCDPWPFLEYRRNAEGWYKAVV